MDLTAENVQTVFADSLASEQPDPKRRPLRVEGLFDEFIFDAARLEAHDLAVRSFLSRASTVFYADRGGGHSCLFLGFRRDGTRWGTLQDMERLLALGLGCGVVRFCLERRRWSLFPDGLPFVSLDGDLFSLWATFRRPGKASSPHDSVALPFTEERHPPPFRISGEDWFKAATFEVIDLKSNPTHVAEAFYNSVIVDGFFDNSLPSWVLDPDTLLQVY